MESKVRKIGRYHLRVEKDVVWFLYGLLYGGRGFGGVDKTEFSYLKEVYRKVEEDYLKEICRDYFKLEEINGKLYVCRL